MKNGLSVVLISIVFLTSKSYRLFLTVNSLS